MNVSIPPGTNLARCSPEKYAGISFAIYKVYGVCFKCKHIQNYYYRSINNLSKGLGKFNGCLRWKFYSNYIERIVSKHQQTIHSLFLDSSLNSDIQNFDDFKKDLEAECLSSLAENERSQSLAYKVDKLSCTIESKFPKWKVIADVDKSEVHLFYLDNSHVVYEIVVLADGSYYFVVKDKHKSLDLIDSIPQAIHCKNQLYLVMKSLEKLNICSGILVEKYMSLLSEDNTSPVFKTIHGDPGAFVETMPITSADKKCIRSTKCSFLIKDMCCKECIQTEHYYMRTLKSRNQNNNSNSKHTRFNYMLKERLIENSKEMAAKIHRMQVKLKRLEQYQQEMSTVGNNTDSDFKTLFKQLYEGISKNIEKHEANVCYWEDCLPFEHKFETAELLQKHISTCHMPTVLDIFPNTLARPSQSFEYAFQTNEMASSGVEVVPSYLF